MAERNLSIIISANNKASTALNKVNRQLNSISGGIEKQTQALSLQERAFNSLGSNGKAQFKKVDTEVNKLISSFRKLTKYI